MCVSCGQKYLRRSLWFPRGPGQYHRPSYTHPMALGGRVPRSVDGSSAFCRKHEGEISPEFD